jgi:hypothetical protein
MVAHDLAMVETRVRFPYSAPHSKLINLEEICFHYNMFLEVWLGMRLTKKFYYITICQTRNLLKKHSDLLFEKKK